MEGAVLRYFALLLFYPNIMAVTLTKKDPAMKLVSCLECRTVHYEVSASFLKKATNIGNRDGIDYAKCSKCGNTYKNFEDYKGEATSQSSPPILARTVPRCKLI